MNNKEIANKLISKSFPKLKNKEIKILDFKIFSGYAVFIPILNLICVNKRCKNFSNKEKIGLLVHELCHAERSNNWGFFKNIFISINYWFYLKLKKKEEKDTDKLAIKKGYAAELFEIKKRFESEFGEIKYGLSSKQIKYYQKTSRRAL